MPLRAGAPAREPSAIFGKRPVERHPANAADEHEQVGPAMAAGLGHDVGHGGVSSRRGCRLGFQFMAVDRPGQVKIAMNVRYDGAMLSTETPRRHRPQGAPPVRCLLDRHPRLQRTDPTRVAAGHPAARVVDHNGRVTTHVSEVPTRTDVEAALVRIHTGIRRTPVIEIHGDELGVPARVVLKLELLQHTGSFKARGALNSVLMADPLPPRVAAVSGGNHGAAVAWAAAHVGIGAEVFVPSTATPEKIERIQGYGGTAHVIDGIVADAFAAGIAWAGQHGVTLIHPYEQFGTICGQGTLGLELLDQVPDVDLVLVGCGGGGLYAGITVAVEGHARVAPVESVGCPDLHAALKAGRPVPVDVTGIAADALGAPEIGATGFELARSHGVDVPLVSDDDIRTARRWLWQRCRILAEPAGCVALAALMTGRVVVEPGTTVVVVLSGGNNPALP